MSDDGWAEVVVRLGKGSGALPQPVSCFCSLVGRGKQGRSRVKAPEHFCFSSILYTHGWGKSNNSGADRQGIWSLCPALLLLWAGQNGGAAGKGLQQKKSGSEAGEALPQPQCLFCQLVKLQNRRPNGSKAFELESRATSRFGQHSWGRTAPSPWPAQGPWRHEAKSNRIGCIRLTKLPQLDTQARMFPEQICLY